MADSLETTRDAREKCKFDPFFLAQMLGYDFGRTRDVHTDLFNDLLKFKPGVAWRDLDRQKNTLILWPRGHYKTSAVCVNIVQAILNYPDIRLLLMQGNLKLTKGWVAEVKSHFTGANPKSMLPKLFPEFCAEKLGSALEFTVPARMRRHLKEATITAASPKAISTGQHYDGFYADDLVHQNNYRNIELLDKLEKEFNLFVPLLDPGSYTTLTGTRYHHADNYGRVIRRNQGEWRVSLRRARTPDDSSGVLLFPERVIGERKIGFTHALLDQIKSDDAEMYSAQYLNEIIVAKSHLFPEPLVLSAVRAIKDNPDFPTSAPSVLVVDLANSKNVDSDHSVVVAGKAAEGNLWVTDCVGSTFSPYQIALVLIQMALKHRPSAILVEKSAGAEYFVEYAKNMAREKGVSLPIQLQKVSNQKDAKYLRVAALERWFKQKKIFLAAGIPDFERLLEEFTQFPKGRHDDRPDAIAMLAEYFSNGIGLVPPKSKLPWFLTAPLAAPPPDPTPDWARPI